MTEEEGNAIADKVKKFLEDEIFPPKIFSFILFVNDGTKRHNIQSTVQDVVDLASASAWCSMQIIEGNPKNNE